MLQIAHPVALQFALSYKNDLPHRFKHLYTQHGFIDATTYLTDADWVHLKELGDWYMLACYYPDIKEGTIFEREMSGGGSDYCCIVKDLIESGEVLRFRIANLY